MSLAEDILDVFDNMAPTTYTASDGMEFNSVEDLSDYILSQGEGFDTTVTTDAKDDEWMCNQLGDIIVDYLAGATVNATGVSGAISGGVFTAGTGTADGWEIESPADAMLTACNLMADPGIAAGWGTAIDTVLLAAKCSFSAVTGTLTTPVGASSTFSIPADGTVAGYGAGTIGTALAITFTAMQPMQKGGDKKLADDMAAAIEGAVSSMIPAVTGTGTGSGAAGSGSTTPGT